jgi:hypothetical protein
MAKMQDDDGNRFLLSSIKNRVSHSLINNLFNPLEVLNLHSNGVISVDNNKNESLLNKSHFDIVNVHETKSITYSNARFTNRIAYVSLQSLTAILCFCFIVYFEEFYFFIFGNYEPSNWELIFFCAPLVYLFSDFYRDKFAKPSLVTIQTEDGATKYLIGRLPDPQMHTASTVMIAIATYGIMISAIDVLTYTKFGSIFETILGLGFIFMCIYLIYTGYISKREINGVNKTEISNDMIHFYFALKSIKYSSNNVINPSSKEISDELKEIKKELQQYNNLMQSVVSAEQIFTASDPSMGVLAIGISTETIMKQACERIGINFKPNARLTLDPLIKKYTANEGIDSRIKSYLEIIKQMRNRAAHDFNINWQEFKTTLDQFCEIVKWHYSAFDESE